MHNSYFVKMAVVKIDSQTDFESIPMQIWTAIMLQHGFVVCQKSLDNSAGNC